MFLCSLIIIPLCFFSSLFSWHHLSFDAGLQTFSNLPAIARSQHYMGIEGTDLYAFFKDLYNKYALNAYKIGPELKIPKIIHQIWLGSPVPSVYEPFMKSWQEKHPDWEYRLWTDENVHSLFPLYNQQ